MLVSWAHALNKLQRITSAHALSTIQDLLESNSRTQTDCFAPLHLPSACWDSHRFASVCEANFFQSSCGHSHISEGTAYQIQAQMIGMLSFVEYPINEFGAPTQQFISKRLIILPKHIGELRQVLGSTIGRAWDAQQPAIQQLRANLRRPESKRATWLLVPGATYTDLLESYSQLCHIATLRFRVANNKQTLKEWSEGEFSQLLKKPASASLTEPAVSGNGEEQAIVISPPMEIGRSAQFRRKGSGLVDDAAWNRNRDFLPPWYQEWLALQIVDKALVIQARKKGRLAKLLKQFSLAKVPAESRDTECLSALRVPRFDFASERVCAAAEFQPKKSKPDSMVLSKVSAADVSVPRSRKRIHTRLFHEGEYLSHCTRCITGPWPDQSRTNFDLDRLFGRSACRRSELLTLKRILTQERLIAGHSWGGGSAGLVSFTSCSWEQLAGMRRYQRHMVRWDFEPYGISIHRALAARIGAIAVQYASKSGKQTSEKKAGLRPQKTSRNQVIRDLRWSYEQEWIVRGNVNLGSISSEDACVFVRDESEISLVEPFSRWPVLTLEELVERSTVDRDRSST